MRWGALQSPPVATGTFHGQYETIGGVGNDLPLHQMQGAETAGGVLRVKGQTAHPMPRMPPCVLQEEPGRFQ